MIEKNNQGFNNKAIRSIGFVNKVNDYHKTLRIAEKDMNRIHKNKLGGAKKIPHISNPIMEK